MQEAVFRRKNHIWFLLMLLCGLAFIGLYLFLAIADPTATNEILVFLYIGIFICLVTIPSWWMALGAFIRIEENRIKARYHFWGRIDCPLSEVTFASAHINTLIIQLANGKTHTIWGIENPWPLCLSIRRYMAFDATEQPEHLRAKLESLRYENRRGLIYVCCGIAFLFINIFITVFLTGSREMQDFTKVDWTIFPLMGILELLTLLVTFYFAHRTGKSNLPVEQLQYTLRRTIIETKPILQDNVIKVFADDNFTCRITIFGFPHEESVYYTIQEFSSEDTLTQVYESETYESIEELQDDLEVFWDITERICRK